MICCHDARAFECLFPIYTRNTQIACLRIVVWRSFLFRRTEFVWFVELQIHNFRLYRRTQVNANNNIHDDASYWMYQQAKKALIRNFVEASGNILIEIRRIQKIDGLEMALYWTHTPITRSNANNDVFEKCLLSLSSFGIRNILSTCRCRRTFNSSFGPNMYSTRHQK